MCLAGMQGIHFISQRLMSSIYGLCVRNRNKFKTPRIVGNQNFVYDQEVLVCEFSVAGTNT